MFRILLTVAGIHLLGFGLLLGTEHTAQTISTGLLAYVLGLRHAFDADHIVAIDATTRKLIHEHKQAHGVGFYFSLGHSTVVFAMTVLSLSGVFSLSKQLFDENSVLRQFGAAIGTTIAITFLFLLASYNLKIMLDILKGQTHKTPTGLFSKYIKPANSAKGMYPIGLLFGLGFDTATSVAMLSLSIVSVTSGNLLFAAIALPIIFTSGMALGDTLGGYLMQQGMKWATAKNSRKNYNLALTIIAVFASTAIGLNLLLSL